jgi:hypothetical protein
MHRSRKVINIFASNFLQTSISSRYTCWYRRHRGPRPSWHFARPAEQEFWPGLL